MHVWAEDEGEGSFREAPGPEGSFHGPPGGDPEAPMGSPSPAGVAARIGARRRPEVAARAASVPIEMGHFDVDMYLTLKLPVPQWLIPNRLIAWVLPRFIRAVWPTLIDMCFNFSGSTFEKRVKADPDGFFAAVGSRVKLGPADPLPPHLRI